MLCVNVKLELELIQSHMAQKPVLRGERQPGLTQSSDWPHVCLYVLKSGLKRLSSLKNMHEISYSISCLCLVG